MYVEGGRERGLVFVRMSFADLKHAFAELATTRLHDADVLVCAGPLWLCLVLHDAAPRLPIVAHCLTHQDRTQLAPQEACMVCWVARADRSCASFSRGDGACTIASVAVICGAKLPGLCVLVWWVCFARAQDLSVLVGRREHVSSRSSTCLVLALFDRSGLSLSVAPLLSPSLFLSRSSGGVVNG